MYFTFLTQCPTLLKILAWTWELVTQLPELHKSYHPKKTADRLRLLKGKLIPKVFLQVNFKEKPTFRIGVYQFINSLCCRGTIITLRIEVFSKERNKTLH
jgi:hypothetical protein